jgi:hypothetical protein
MRGTAAMHDAATAWRREIRRRLRAHATGAAVWAAIALGCGFGAARLVAAQAGPDVEETQALVVGRPLRGAEAYLALEWMRGDGTRGTSEHPAWYAPDARVGDRIPLLYSTRDARFVRPMTAGDRIARAVFRGLGAMLGVGALAWFAVAAARARRRVDLVDRGERLPAHATAVEHRDLPLGRAGAVRRWRVRATWFDDALPGWRTVRSSWQADEPSPGALRDAVVLRLPGTRRAWLPQPVEPGVHSSTG